MKYEKSNEEHPSNESMANLIDRTLGITERKSIEKHMLVCVDCRSVVMESFKEKREELQVKRKKRILQVAILLAIVASIIWVMAYVSL